MEIKNAMSSHRVLFYILLVSYLLLPFAVKTFDW